MKIRHLVWKTKGMPVWDNKRALTLLELLVVIVVIGILVGISVPVVGRTRETARRSVCMSNVRQIGIAFRQYAMDNDGIYPGGSNSANTVFNKLIDGNYIDKSYKIFVCPSDFGTDVGSATEFGSNNVSYACVVKNTEGDGLPDDITPNNPLIFDIGVTNEIANIAVAKVNKHRFQHGKHKAKGLSKKKGGTGGESLSFGGAHEWANGGNIFYVGGNVVYAPTFDGGEDGTNGVIKAPGAM